MNCNLNIWYAGYLICNPSEEVIWLQKIMWTTALIPHDQISYVLRDWSETCTWPASFLCMYDIASNLGFSVGFLMVQMTGSLILVPFLRLFSSCFFVLFKYDMLPFSLTIYYFVIFYHYHLAACLLAKKIQNGSGSMWEEGTEELEGAEYRNTIINIYYMRKNYFQLKKEN